MAATSNHQSSLIVEPPQYLQSIMKLCTHRCLLPSQLTKQMVQNQPALISTGSSTTPPQSPTLPPSLRSCIYRCSFKYNQAYQFVYGRMLMQSYQLSEIRKQYQKDKLNGEKGFLDKLHQLYQEQYGRQ